MHNDGIYQSQLPVRALMNDLESLANLDKESEKKISFWGKIRILLFVLGVISLILGLISINERLGIEALAFMGGLGMIIIGCVITFSTLKKLNRDEFPDYRYLTCQKLLGLLSADIDNHSEIETRLNLKEKLSPNQTIEKGKKGSSTWNRRITSECFLSLNGVFLDGTKFRCSITEEVQAYGEHFPYRSLSGKTKTKLKANKRTRWIGALRLRFKEKRYSSSPTESQQIEDLIQIPDRAKLKKLEVNDQELLMSSATETNKQKHNVKMSKNIPAAWDDMEIDANSSDMLKAFMAQMFLSLYQALNSSKTKKK